MEISKQMLSKLEQAVEKISESNRDISQILVRHDERIEYTSENNNTMIRHVDNVEKELREEIVKNSQSIEEIKRARWIWVGAIIASTFFLTELKVVDRLLKTPLPNAEQISPSSRP